jgi:hypothetical protein
VLGGQSKNVRSDYLVILLMGFYSLIHFRNIFRVFLLSVLDSWGHPMKKKKKGGKSEQKFLSSE